MGIRMKERRLIISHENKRVKEACRKQKVLCAQQLDPKFKEGTTEFTIIDKGRTTREGAVWLVMEAPEPL